MSNRAQNLLNIDIEAVQSELADTESEFDGETEQYVKRVWLGTVFGLTPSGKIYTPFACSNVLGDCPVCNGSGKTSARKNKKTVKRAKAREESFAKRTLKRKGSAKAAYAQRVKHARMKAHKLASDSCPCCYGSGSLSATKDELYSEALTQAAQSIGAYVDYFDDSIFISRLAEEQE